MRKLVFTVVWLGGVVFAFGQAGPAARQVIPAAASTEGAAESFWRTELTAYNAGLRNGQVLIELIPSGIAGGLEEPESVVLPEPLEPLAVLVISDVMGTYFPDHPTGALVVSCRSDQGEALELIAASRTWTPASEGGSYGQGIPGIAWSEDGDLAASEQVLPGLEESEDFRTNLGIVNLSGTLEETFTVDVVDSFGTVQGSVSYTLGPRAHLQVNSFLSELDLVGAGYSATVRLSDWRDVTPAATGAGEPDYVAYASKIDLTSNDPFYIEAQPDAIGYGPARMRLIPAAANTAGQAGSFWRTDLTMFCPAEQRQASLMYIDFIPSGLEGAADDPPDSSSFRFISGGSVTVEDVLGSRFPDYSTGALLVRVMDSALLDVRVNSRTWTPSGDGEGSMGQGIAGISMAPTSDPQVILGLESTENRRSNLGLVNPSLNLRQTLEVQIQNSAGGSEGRQNYTLEPWAHLQINGVLDDFGCSGTGYTAVISLVSSENLMVNPSESWEPVFSSYGSSIDSQSNDPVYLKAVSTGRKLEEEGDWYDFVNSAPWYVCPEAEFPAEATVVTAFDQAYHYFGAENQRTIVGEVDFPETGDWNQVGLYLHLECPESGLCDDWDRSGSLQMVLNPEDPEEDWEYLEIIRHITPYGMGMCQFVDITHLASLLTGHQTLVSWIDTWVGPGHSSGEGWRITFDFVFYPGTPRVADEVINIWGRRRVIIGHTDPDNNVDSQIEPFTAAIPADAIRVEARLITTGHSFENSNNCAEFCILRQDLMVNDEVTSVLPWRTDCEHNPVSGQPGTWEFDRNGWCPGVTVVGNTIDVTDQVVPGADNIFDFDIRTDDGEEYENTSPGDYEPFEYVSLQLYVFTEP